MTSARRALAAILLALGALGLAAGAFVALAPPDAVTLPAPDALPDLERVHAEMLPAWVVAGANADPRAAADALRAALAGEPGLAAVFEDLARHAATPEDDAEALLADVDRWNARLARLGAPWRVEGAVLLGERPYFYVKCYRVLHEGDGRLGDTAVRLRVARRVDGLNVVERYLGATRPAQGATVIADRVAEYVLDELWPALDPSPGRGAGEQAWRDALRAELVAGVGEAHVGTLEATARDRAALLAVVGAIAARRACGSDLAIARPPWSGFAPDDRRRLWGYAAASVGDPCPAVLDAEALVVDERSRALADTAELEPALAAAISLSARAFAAHEARHVSDGLRYGRAADAPCAGCALDDDARVELAAYAGSLAEPGLSAIAAWQACALDEGAHARAFAALTAAVAPGLCAGGPPPDLAARAAAYDRATFGNDARVTLPEPWPAAIAP